MSNSLVKNVRIALHRNLISFGIDLRKKREDRRLLEQVIFPEILGNAEYQRILFVGCAWYTLHYPRIFASRDFTTMELCPRESQYGARNHIQASCETIADHFEPNSLDVVIFNGVYGFGLNEMDAIDRTHRGIYQSVRPGGLLVYGWNDSPERAPYPFDTLTGLEHFSPFVFPPLKKSVHESDTKNRHRFHFYVKRELERSVA